MVAELSGHERRITLRLLAYWEKRRGARAMPAAGDIRREDIGDLWDNCFLVHVHDLDKPHYDYSHLGEALAALYQGLWSGHTAAGPAPAAAKITAGYRQVAESAKPLLEEGEFLNHKQQTVKYRQCLLPLGEGGQVHAILGGMRFKVLPLRASLPGAETAETTALFCR